MTRNGFEKFVWTRHAQDKLRYYRLSESRVKRIIRHPARVEEGILEGAVACMQPAGSRKYSEIWTMYVLVKTGGFRDDMLSRPDSSAPAADFANSRAKFFRLRRKPSPVPNFDSCLRFHPGEEKHSKNSLILSRQLIRGSQRNNRNFGDGASKLRRRGVPLWALRAPRGNASRLDPPLSQKHIISTAPLIFGGSKIKIITAWRYPGKSPVRDPIPAEILREIRNTF